MGSYANTADINCEYYSKPDVFSLNKRINDLEERIEKQDKNIILLTEKINILLSKVKAE